MANGKVRCGQCEHIFNALENLYETESEADISAEHPAQSATEQSLTSEPVSSPGIDDSTTSITSSGLTGNIEPTTPDISFKEKMERITASLSAATQELKTVRETSVQDDSSFTGSSDIIDSEFQTRKIEQPTEQPVAYESQAQTPVDERVTEEAVVTPPEPEPEPEPEPDEELDILDFNDTEVEDEEENIPLTDFSTRKVEQEDLDILNSLISASNSQSSAQTGDDDLLDDQEIINVTLGDEGDSLDEQLASDLDELDALEQELTGELDNELEQDEQDTIEDEISLDSEIGGSHDSELDDADDLLAELEQLEQEIVDNSELDSAVSAEDNSSAQEAIVMETAPEPETAEASAPVKKQQEEVVPSFLTQNDARPTNPNTMFAWLGGTIVLVITLTLQYLHFNSVSFAQNSTFRPFLESLCPVTGCALPLKKAPSKIITVNHDVRTHPKINNALEIQLTFKNKAQFTQGYPVLEIIFSNPRGEVVAQRQFLPDEYLTADIQAEHGIKHDQSQDVWLKIIDPDPGSLLSFQFNYL